MNKLPVVYAAMFILAVMGVLLLLIVTVIERRALRWHDSQRTDVTMRGPAAQPVTRGGVNPGRGRLGLAVAGAVLACLAAACGSPSSSGGGSGGAPGGGTGASGTAGGSRDISAARCAQNRAAGKITYLSGYQYQASASILEYVAASKLGYFSDLCLNVALAAGHRRHLAERQAAGQRAGDHLPRRRAGPDPGAGQRHRHRGRLLLLRRGPRDPHDQPGHHRASPSSTARSSATRATSRPRSRR